MRVLIFGSKGMLGKEIHSLFSKEHDVFAYDKEDIDITDKDAVTLCILDRRPDIVINCTANNAVDAIEEDVAVFSSAMKVNGMALQHIALACNAVGAILIHFSTDYVFNGQNKNGYNEDAQPSPISRYGRTKHLGEEVVSRFAKNYYIIRVSRLFGEPALSANAKLSFIDIMLQLAQRKEKLDIVSEEYSSPSYAPDIADYTHKLLKNSYTSGIYHAVNTGVCNWSEFAKKAFEIKNISIDIKEVSASTFVRPAARPPHSQLLNTKGPQMRSWEEALKEYLS